MEAIPSGALFCFCPVNLQLHYSVSEELQYVVGRAGYVVGKSDNKTKLSPTLLSFGLAELGNKH